MTKQEIEKAIENGESVWVANKYCLPYGVELTRNYYVDMVSDKEGLMLEHLDHVEFIDYLDCIFKTKDKAQHYYDHANITRAETLPFLTWEEFLKKRCFYFTNYSDYYGMDTVNKEFSLELNVSRDKILLFSYEAIPLEEWEATEANFYKAYDECERLFKGRSDINELEK